MARRYIKRFLPHPDRVRNHRHLQWLGPAIHHPDLWQLNRRSVAGGVAVGAFFAFMLPIAQFIAAALTAMIFRVNLPVAMTATLITNPFTFPLWYLLAYRIGAWIMGANGGEPPKTPDEVLANVSWLEQITGVFDTMMAMGQPLLVGLVILAILFAVLGYFTVDWLWRLPAYLRLRRLRRQRGRV